MARREEGRLDSAQATPTRKVEESRAVEKGDSQGTKHRDCTKHAQKGAKEAQKAAEGWIRVCKVVGASQVTHDGP